ncbi:leucyl aminopeptidase family protein [Cesiribacter andamanensis]|uniref:Cytosol aminopeptidase n=1 Tax=Cesiribacter andamanensis AMV16 TaxID=1279009 RepID=M7NLR7_9BACT|nr:leucyl aminopeptidase [Cesiribacter andamanensis]EMR02715.1 Cytosol aminopeptidase [Cesiribacter andamanensis AMV16]
MQPAITLAPSLQENQHTVYLLAPEPDFSPLGLSEAEQQWVSQKLKGDEGVLSLNRYHHWIFLVKAPKKQQAPQQDEAWRQAGHKLAGLLKKEKVQALQLGGGTQEQLLLLEGLLLSLYSFDKYKTKKQDSWRLQDLTLISSELNMEQVRELQQLVSATWHARTLINEPVVYLTATQLSRELEGLGREAGFAVEVFEEGKIQSLKMGGLLAVNAGSTQPPTFNVLEYKPEGSVNSKPLILVGKGVVYDTGGLSLKPTAGSMDLMKSDMSGAATVAGALYALAANKLPVWVVGLIPATDNRPGEEAITPGDVITMCDGTTVEILNTDAEGRLILADALSYAKKYSPELVLDFATLTGAAARAIGPEGTVCMGTASEAIMQELKQAGEQTYERLVEFPLWEEYEKQLESSIADLTNLGGPNAGAITAGLFLKHFTDYPWVHFDIAGPAFLTKADSYRGKGGTGVGVRLLYRFIKHHYKLA